MDRALGIEEPKVTPKFREWLSKKDTPGIVALSIHEHKLGEHYQTAKDVGVLLVYLRKSKERIAEHVKLRQPNGEFRPQPHQDYTVQSYERLDKVFSEAADREIHCSDMSTADVANEVRRILETAVTPSNADA